MNLKKQLFLYKNKRLIKIKFNNNIMENLIHIKILKFFLDNPYYEVYLRELAKKLKLSPFAAKKYLDLLLKENLITEERKANLRYFKANISNLFFRYMKISFSINILLKSGIIKFLKDNVENVSSIVLFGSMAKGEDDKNSDIDIVVIGKEKSIDLREFEAKFGKEINLHVFSWSKWNKEADHNRAFYFDIIAYGIPLYGELPIVK